ncbi:type II toxin-antitoxin system VapC family toxin [Candidatus Bathyarchaeota archaeon]|nr:MAG: type II toxin-antitoxin system VapC family toxin [Candidatus Bathyarchaeota archaeon]
MAYVDTNVLIAAYTSKDPMRKPAKAFLASTTTPTFVSPLTFTEIVSVVARNDHLLETPLFLKEESSTRRVRALAEYIIRDSGVSMASPQGSSRTRIGGRSVVIPIEYSRAASLAAVLKLRTLDLLHLAYAYIIGRIEYSLTSFVTGDALIASRAKQIHQLLGLDVKHPADET